MGLRRPGQWLTSKGIPNTVRSVNKITTSTTTTLRNLAASSKVGVINQVAVAIRGTAAADASITIQVGGSVALIIEIPNTTVVSAAIPIFQSVGDGSAPIAVGALNGNVEIVTVGWTGLTANVHVSHYELLAVL